MREQDYIDLYDPPHIECWQCAGEGTVSYCFEEFACIDPEGGCEDCTRTCDICKGKGGWPDPSYGLEEDPR